MADVGSPIELENFRESLRQYTRGILDDAKALAMSLGLEVETQMRDLEGGRVADAIVEEAKNAGCDLIVIGTHGRRGFNLLLLGSDAERVLRQSPIPVLLVRMSSTTS